MHGRDGHRHFFPVSGWRFESPPSYWERERHAAVVGLVELALVWLCVWVLAGRGVPALVVAALIAVAVWYPWHYFGRRS
jgi:hypothetical protein